jgi:hypothetical protein
MAEEADTGAGDVAALRPARPPPHAARSTTRPTKKRRIIE